jgi:dihydrodipicolinate synthase/N-acetylneuraminate lyase
MHFPGVIPAIQTPFQEDGSIDHPVLARTAQRLLDGGMTGLVACGTMGEAQGLTAAERQAVVATLVEAVDGRVGITAGISAETAGLAAGYAADAAAVGATAVMALAPLGYGADDDELVAWYQAIDAGTDLPLMAYNNPKAHGADMSAATIIRLAEEVEGLVAIKEASGDVRRIPEILHGAGDRLEVLVGGDDWALEGFAAGATGWISGVAVVAPAECNELYERLLPLARLDMTNKLVQYFKAAQDLLGVEGGGPLRSPRLPLNAEEQAIVRAAVDRLRTGAVATA